MERLLPRLEALGEAVLERLQRGVIVRVTELAMLLGVSEEEVRRAVEGLRGWGLPMEEGPEGVYRLAFLDELESLEEVLGRVGARADVIYIKHCERSSQDIARELADGGAGEWTVVVCDEMLRGRGRLGRPWRAPRGGLWFTVILRPGPSFRAPPSLLSLAAGAAVSEAVRAVAGVRAEVKWPNDVLVEGRKLCGILAEAFLEEGSGGLVLLGVGLNANNEPPLEGAVSLKEVLGREVPRATVLAVALARLWRYYALLSEGKVEEVLEAWASLSSTVGREVRVILLDGGEITGRALGVDGLGRLMVESGGNLHHVEAGEVYHLR